MKTITKQIKITTPGLAEKLASGVFIHENSPFCAVLFDSNHASITHVPTGAAMVQGNYKLVAVLFDRLEKTLSDEQRIELSKLKLLSKARKNKTLKAIARWMRAAIRCENNRELESMVGVFYRDRADAEKLRWKINPNNKTLLDDNALLSESMIATLIIDPSIKV